MEITLVAPDGVTSTREMVRFEESAIAGFIASFARRLKIPFEEIHLEGTQRDNGVEHGEISGAIGGPTQFRSVAKMGLAAQAHQRALRPANTRAKRLAEWISDGGGEWPFALDPRAGPAFRGAAGTHVGTHLLAVFEGPARRWEVAFVAFGAIAYRAELPRPAAGFSPLVHVVDPRVRAHSVRVDFHPPMLRDIREVLLADEYGQAALDELMAWVRANAAVAVAHHPAQTTAPIDVGEILRIVRERLGAPG
ncbi:MAG: hypothetical protein ACOZNI_27945 [Myxococcota bacterium]